MVRPLAAAVVAAVLIVPACGASDDESSAPNDTGTSTPTTQPAGTGTTTGPATTAEAPPGTVVIVDFRFSPRDLSVARGEAVTWRNDDPYDHWVLATDPDVLDSGEMSEAQTYSKTFSQAGTYEYYCNIHNYMKATITVR